jgi:hypothetical protein
VTVSITVGLALTTVLAAVVLILTVLVGQIIVLVLTVTQNLVQWGTTSLALGFGFLNDTVWDFVKEKTKGWLDERLTEWLLRHWIEPWRKLRTAGRILRLNRRIQPGDRCTGVVVPGPGPRAVGTCLRRPTGGGHVVRGRG